MAAQRNATLSNVLFPGLATGCYFYATVPFSNFKMYILFRLPLLSIYFYFIAYHVGDIWLLNVWRIGPFFILFFILPFVSVCCNEFIFVGGRRQGRIGSHTHTNPTAILSHFVGVWLHL